MLMAGAVFAAETPVVRGAEKSVASAEAVEDVDVVKLVAAIERLLEYRKASNPELAPKLGGVAARLEEEKMALSAVGGDGETTSVRQQGRTAAVGVCDRGHAGRVPQPRIVAAEEALKRLEGVKRELMVDLNPSVKFDRILFIRRKNAREYLSCN
jgi:hypothetical protein